MSLYIILGENSVFSRRANQDQAQKKEHSLHKTISLLRSDFSTKKSYHQTGRLCKTFQRAAESKKSEEFLKSGMNREAGSFSGGVNGKLTTQKREVSILPSGILTPKGTKLNLTGKKWSQMIPSREPS
jgi:hypothetical protein